MACILAKLRCIVNMTPFSFGGRETRFTFMKRVFFLTVLVLFARPLWAHPHIFIDTGFEVHVDEKGRLAHIEITWAYDAFYSLLVTENYNLDADGDAVLTEAEKEALNGFDMAWVPGFNGDLVVTVDGQEMTLSRPRDFTTDMKEGRVITTHIRDIAEEPNLIGASLEVIPFDATYYTAYDVTYPVTTVGPAQCDVEKVVPELDSQLEDLRSALSQLTQDENPVQMGLPNAGGSFATKLAITCSAG